MQHTFIENFKKPLFQDRRPFVLQLRLFSCSDDVPPDFFHSERGILTPGLESSTKVSSQNLYCHCRFERPHLKSMQKTLWKSRRLLPTYLRLENHFWSRIRCRISPGRKSRGDHNCLGLMKSPHS